jgi:phosphoenolpyruvate synthase/pyruvate phosphate dikinase
MDKKRRNPLAELMARKTEKDRDKAIDVTMARVKKEFGELCDAELSRIVTVRYRAAREEGFRDLVVFDDESQPGVKRLEYDGDLVAVLHAPEFEVSPHKSVGLVCSARMVIDEVCMPEPLKRHRVEIRHAVLCF